MKEVTYEDIQREWQAERDKEQAMKLTHCQYQWKEGGVCGTDIWTCNKEATHKHSSGLGLCHRHFNKTLSGTLSTKAWKHGNKPKQHLTTP